MICPKCKSQVCSTDLNCPECGFKINIKCPRCNNLTKIGHPTCAKCGFVFVKFCPECNSANYASAKECRKCFYKFEPEKPEETEEKEPPQQANKIQEDIKTGKKLFIYLDFVSLVEIFNKYKDNEFKEKVFLNVKNYSKEAFKQNGEFINSYVYKIPYEYKDDLPFLEVLSQFEKGLDEFNELLESTLSVRVSFKTAIALKEEIEKDKPLIEQLKHGEAGDIIVSNEAYKILSNEFPLIRISPNSYKAVFKKEKPQIAQTQTLKSEEAQEKLFYALNNNDTIRAVSLSAKKGSGKTYLLSNLLGKFSENPPLFLFAQCSALTQVSPVGLFSDIFLTLFGLNFNLENYEENAKALKAMILRDMPAIKSSSADILINLLYPLKTSYFENIIKNKQKTYEALREILENIKQNQKIIIVIDDFDGIDNASYEFLTHLIFCGFFEQNAKLLAIYKDQRPLQGYLYSEKLPQNAFFDVYLDDNDKERAENLIVSQYKNSNVLPSKIKEQIYINSNGNLAYIENMLHYLCETNAVSNKEEGYSFNELNGEVEIFKDLNLLLEKRINILKTQNDNAYKSLCLAALLGNKFSLSLIAQGLSLNEEEFLKIVNLLSERGYIYLLNNRQASFKNDSIWSYVYERVKHEDSLKSAVTNLLNILSSSTLSTTCIRALLAENIGEKQLAFEIWTQTMKCASYIGDIGLYILAQKQCLLLIENINLENETTVRNNIYERLGKLLYNQSPKEAIEFLSNAIVASQKDYNENKTIELAGYLVNACYKIGNYPGVIETVDLVLSMFEDEHLYKLQKTLIKTRKLNALLFMGNFEEIINTVNFEINPPLQEFLKKPKLIRYTDFNSIYLDWLESNLILANALALAGNPLCFGLIEELEKEIFSDKNSNLDAKFKISLGLITALANSLKGYVKISEDILQSIVKDFSYIMQDGLLVSKWNLVNIINKVFRHDYTNIKQELFEAVSFANNTRDEYTKNLLKTILANVLLDEGNPEKSFEICQEQAAYFSKEKLAQGAILTWYVSASASFALKSYDKAITIIQKALDICQNSKINNEYFKIYFQKLLSQIYLSKGDIEGAKMYAEQALELACANELVYLEMLLYRLYATCIQASIASIAQEKKKDIASNIIRIYEKAKNLAEKLDVEFYKSILQKDLTAFRAYCQLNRIDY